MSHGFVGRHVYISLIPEKEPAHMCRSPLPLKKVVFKSENSCVPDSLSVLFPLLSVGLTRDRQESQRGTILYPLTTTATIMLLLFVMSDALSRDSVVYLV